MADIRRGAVNDAAIKHAAMTACRPHDARLRVHCPQVRQLAAAISRSTL
jgi:hypothetical protein